jgi:hypothetical protein
MKILLGILSFIIFYVIQFNNETKVLLERKIPLPYLHINISIPFFQVATEIMNQSVDRYAFQYITLYVKIYKWIFNFGLYSPGYALRMWRKK